MGNTPHSSKKEHAKWELERIARNPGLADQYTEEEIEELEMIASGEH